MIRTIKESKGYRRENKDLNSLASSLDIPFASKQEISPYKGEYLLSLWVDGDEFIDLVNDEIGNYDSVDGEEIPHENIDDAIETFMNTDQSVDSLEKLNTEFISKAKKLGIKLDIDKSSGYSLYTHNVKKDKNNVIITFTFDIK